MAETAPTPRTRLRRIPERGRYDRATLDAILDEGFVCHVAFVADREPFVIPTVYARAGDQIYLHGSSANRMLRVLRRGAPACLGVTLVDGLVLARSAFHHSVNFRSVVLFGTAVAVEDPEEKAAGLRAIVEHVVPRRLPDVRDLDPLEVTRTLVVRLPIDEASAKVRTGPPAEEPADYALDCWAGEIPLRLVPQAPVPDPKLRAGIPTPEYVSEYRRPGE